MVRADPLDQTATRLAWAIGIWLILQVLFNDIGRLVTINVGFNLRPDRLFIPVLLICFAVHRHRNPVSVRMHPAEWCSVVLFLWGMASLVIAGTIHHPYNRHLATLINLVPLPMCTLFVVRRSTLSPRHVAIVLRVLIGLGVYLSITALAEHYNLSALVFPKYILDPLVGLHWGRSRGPFGNAAVMGGVLTITYLATLFYAANVRDTGPLRPLLRLLLGLIAVAVYFTYTRSAWLTLSASLVALAAFRGPMRRHCIAVALIVLLAFVSGALSKLSLVEGTLFSKRQGPVEDRENIMRASIAMIKERPFLGFGYGTFQSSNTDYFDEEGRRSIREGNHNAFTGLFVELGLLGVIPYTMTWWFLLRASWRLARRSTTDNRFWQQVGALSVATLVGYLLGVQFFDPRFFGLMNCLAAVIAGLACAADERYAPQAISST